ncbi:MAG: methyltransferase domain-containing protein [Aestuariibacter sp.]
MNAMNATKYTIAKAFGAAAEQYDKQACIQKLIAKEALQRARNLMRQVTPQNCLDIGCGTGSATVDLRSETANLTGIDIAPGMVKYAMRQHGLSDINWMVGDAEELPVSDNSVDFLYSCMALQWLDSADAFAQECARVLSDKGQGFLAILTAGSLFELADTWQELNIPPTVNRFLGSDQWRNALLHHNIEVSIDEKRYVDWHPNLFGVLHSIKDVGAGVNTESKSLRLTRGQLRQLESTYRHRFGGERGLPLTYRVSLIHMEKGK